VVERLLNRVEKLYRTRGSAKKERRLQCGTWKNVWLMRTARSADLVSRNTQSFIWISLYKLLLVRAFRTRRQCEWKKRAKKMGRSMKLKPLDSHIETLRWSAKTVHDSIRSHYVRWVAGKVWNQKRKAKIEIHGFGCLQQ